MSCLPIFRAHIMHTFSTRRRRCKAYRFDAEEWKERGTGDVKVLKHKTTSRCRIVMRQEKTMKLVLNHQGWVVA